MTKQSLNWTKADRSQYSIWSIAISRALRLISLPFHSLQDRHIDLSIWSLVFCHNPPQPKLTLCFPCLLAIVAYPALEKKDTLLSHCFPTAFVHCWRLETGCFSQLLCLSLSPPFLSFSCTPYEHNNFSFLQNITRILELA